MTAPQIHLMLNHLPVVGALFAAIVLGVGVAFRIGPIARLGLATLLAIALAAFPVFFSGEPAEEAIEHAVGIVENAVEPHEDAARVSMIGLQAIGLVALFGLVRYRRRPVPRGFAAGVMVATVALFATLAWTAHLGGQIRHPEITGAVKAGGEAAETNEH